jgi:hypothetical protein
VKSQDEIIKDEAQDDELASLLAQSRQALANYEKAIGNIDRSTIGAFYGMPSRMQADGWIFYRCGTRGAPMAEALAATFRLHGWVDAPKAVQCRGFEDWDGARGGSLILTAPADVYRRMKDVQKKARQRAGITENTIADSLASEFRGIGVEVEALTVDVSELGGEEFDARSKGARRPQRRT